MAHLGISGLFGDYGVIQGFASTRVQASREP